MVASRIARGICPLEIRRASRCARRVNTASGPALLIALTGSPGEGRTRLLAAFAAEAQQRGQRVAGFLAVGGPRPGPHAGADFYRLQMLGEENDLPWATRDDSCHPPYRFDAATFEHVAAWARGLRQQERADLLVLDEFGRFEAEGRGWWPIWSDIAAAAPRIVLMSVRAGCTEQIAARLGRPFDLVLPVADPGTPHRLQRACADFSEWTQVGLWGGAAGALEMSLGSVLHAMKVPLRGAALCSAQAATLTFASARLSVPARVAWVAFIAAGLKAFSPGGGRVRPMVAISVQGTLFATAVQLLGWNAPGVLLGGLAIGAWAALQGILVQYLLLGEDLVTAYAKATEWLAANWGVAAPSLATAIAVWAGLHALLAGAAAVTAWKLRAPPARMRQFIEQDAPGAPAGAPARPRRAAVRIAREFSRWHFWLPLLIVSAILLASGRSWENVAWLVARFLAVGAVLLALLSTFQPVRLAAFLRRRGWWGPAAAFAEAFARKRPTR